MFVAIAKFGGPAYKSWAETQVAKIRDVLNSAREDHTQAVRDRIENVSQMGTVVEVTKDLFAVSKVRFFFPPVLHVRGILLVIYRYLVAQLVVHGSDRFIGNRPA